MVNSGELGIIYISKVFISRCGLGVYEHARESDPGVVLFILIIHPSTLLCHINVSLNVMSLVITGILTDAMEVFQNK